MAKEPDIIWRRYVPKGPSSSKLVPNRKYGLSVIAEEQDIAAFEPKFLISIVDEYRNEIVRIAKTRTEFESMVNSDWEEEMSYRRRRYPHVVVRMKKADETGDWDLFRIFPEDLLRLENAFVDRERLVLNVLQLEFEDDPPLNRIGLDMSDYSFICQKYPEDV